MNQSLTGHHGTDHSDRFGGIGSTALLSGAVGFGLGVAAMLGRRVAVQAPTMAAGDWLDGLKREHKMTLGLLDALEQTGPDETKKRAALLFQLQHALGKHAVQEEDIIYCAVRDHGASDQADDLNHDHGYVKQHLYDLEQMDKGDPQFADKVRELRSLIKEHVEREETDVLAKLHSQLSDDQNRALTRRMNREGMKVG
ncbi:MAG: hemerythrin domain-containing protein [Pacificimonas sp.]|jgi:hemerythrin-like domain-containing protein|nr:hemerythrin domain-containing protein [Pacificimonas sp.]